LDEQDLQKIKSVPFVRYITREAHSDQANRPPRRRQARGPRSKHLPKSRATVGNIDLAVLKAENQNATHVTPRIAKLAQGLFREEIEVVGPPPPPINKVQMENEKKKQYVTLKALYGQAKKARKKVDYKKEDRISVRDDMYKSVQVDGVVYNVSGFDSILLEANEMFLCVQIGDVILTPREIIFKTGAPVPHLGDRIDHFFW
jgi:DNA (cytosine-5)-methyltransferase 1